MTKQNTKQTAASVAAAQAETVRAALSDSLTKAATAGTAVLVKLYGAGADTASIKLARSAAAVLAGGTKPRGGAADRINRVIAAVIEATGDESDNLTPAVLAAAARAVLDAHKAAVKAHRDGLTARRKAANDKVNDRGAGIAAQKLAIEERAAVDAEIAALKGNGPADRLASALDNARRNGMSYESVMSLVLAAYPVEDERAEELAA
jgi:hypothetical protein